MNKSAYLTWGYASDFKVGDVVHMRRERVVLSCGNADRWRAGAHRITEVRRGAMRMPASNWKHSGPAAKAGWCLSSDVIVTDVNAQAWNAAFFCQLPEVEYL